MCCCAMAPATRPMRFANGSRLIASVRPPTRWRCCRRGFPARPEDFSAWAQPGLDSIGCDESIQETRPMPVITTIEDLRLLAKARVPRMFYDYADSGSWTESTYRANEHDFRRIQLRQRVAVNMEGRSLRTQM